MSLSKNSWYILVTGVILHIVSVTLIEQMWGDLFRTLWPLIIIPIIVASIIIWQQEKYYETTPIFVPSDNWKPTYMLFALFYILITVFIYVAYKITVTNIPIPTTPTVTATAVAQIATQQTQTAEAKTATMQAESMLNARASQTAEAKAATMQAEAILTTQASQTAEAKAATVQAEAKVATPIPIPPTATPMPTATYTPLPEPTDRPTATPMPLPGKPANTPVPALTATPTPISYATPELIEPLPMVNISTNKNVTFEWEWNGTLAQGHGFEVRIWKDNETHFGGYDAAETLKQVSHEGNRYKLTFDVSQAWGVTQHRNGDYLWSVAIVTINPYTTIVESLSRPIKINVFGGGGGGTSPYDPGPLQ